ncbi:hypothetical protein DIPPA_28525 [Diplonema papillatum]|nr:hypothetical protein DIPPA_28525 [Diplonema papillatum]
MPAAGGGACGACVRAPLPHPLGAGAVFLEGPAFVVPADVSGALLTVAGGPPGGVVAGNSARPAARERDGGVELVFDGCTVTREGEYTFRCELLRGGDRKKGWVDTPPFAVRTAARPDAGDRECLAGGLAVFAAAIAANVAGGAAGAGILGKERLGGVLDRVYDTARPRVVLPAPGRVLSGRRGAFEQLREMAWAAAAAGTTAVEAHFLNRAFEPAAALKEERLAAANGQAAAKIAVLAGDVRPRDARRLRKAADQYRPEAPCGSSGAAPRALQPAAAAVFEEQPEAGGRGRVGAFGVDCRVPGDTRGRDLAVSAVVARLPPVLRTGGGAVSIKAAVLLLPAEGCVIDTSGPHGTGHAGDAPAPPGQDGAAGEPGGSTRSAVTAAPASTAEQDGRARRASPAATAATAPPAATAAPAAPLARRAGSWSRSSKPPASQTGRRGTPRARGLAGARRGGAPAKPEEEEARFFAGLAVRCAAGAAPRAARGGAGGPGGPPGAPCLTPHYVASGYWWNRSHTINTSESETSAARRHGKQGKEGAAGSVPPEEFGTVAHRCAVPASYFWGHVVEKGLLGKTLQWAELLYQSGLVDPAERVIRVVHAALAIQHAYSQRSVEPLLHRASLLLKQLSCGYDYWGLSSNYHPLFTYSSLREKALQFLVEYEAVYKAWEGRKQAEGKSAALRAQVRQAKAGNEDLLSAHRQMASSLRRVETEVLEEMTGLASSLASSRVVMATLAADLTRAVVDEAAEQTVAKFREADAAEKHSKALTIVSTALSIWPSLPPSPTVIATLVAQGRDADEATAAYFKVAQDSLCAIGAQLLSSSREFFSDRTVVKQKTEEALGQIIAEAQSDKSEIALEEVDRWVNNLQLKGTRTRQRDAYLSGIRNHQRLMKATDMNTSKLDEIRQQVATVDNEVAKLEAEARVLEHTLALDGYATSALAEGDELLRAVADAQKTAGYLLHLVHRAYQREFFDNRAASTLTSNPDSARAALLALECRRIAGSGAGAHGVRRREAVSEPIEFSAKKLIRSLNETGACVFGVGPNDQASLPGRAEEVLLRVKIRVTPASPGTSFTLTHLGSSAFFRDRHGGNHTFCHPPLSFDVPLDEWQALPQDQHVGLSPFSLYRLRVDQPAIKQPGALTPTRPDSRSSSEEREPVASPTSERGFSLESFSVTFGTSYAVFDR